MSSIDPDASGYKRTLWFVTLLILGGLVALGWGIKYLFEFPRRQAQRNIAAVQSGLNDVYFAMGQTELDEFVQQSFSLQGAKPFHLDIEYTEQVDEALQKIEGLDSVESLNLAKCSVTDVGMQSVAMLPKLKKLSLYHVRVSDIGLAHLAKCPKLESLILDVYGRFEISDDGLQSIAAIPNLSHLELSAVKLTDVGIDHLIKAPKLESLDLDVSGLGAIDLARLFELPQLKKLTLRNELGKPTISDNLSKLQGATMLNELILIRAELSDDEIAQLREMLPKTKLRLERHPL